MSGCTFNEFSYMNTKMDIMYAVKCDIVVY